MTPKEAYEVLQAASGIKVGDTVKVLRRAKDSEMGWGGLWLIDMNPCVGREFTVLYIQKEGSIKLNTIERASTRHDYWFPFFVLEKVIDAPLKPKHGDVVNTGDGKRIIVEVDGELCSFDAEGARYSCSTNATETLYRARAYTPIANVFDEEEK